LKTKNGKETSLSNMNDFLVNVIYKNTQKIRFKNGMEEKLLRRSENSFTKKLKTSLSKIDKTQQVIEAEYRHMESEMRKLGIDRQRRVSDVAELQAKKLPMDLYDYGEEIKEVDDDDENYSLTDDSSNSRTGD